MRAGAEDARLHVGDALLRHRVRLQVGGRDAGVGARSLLHAGEEIGHRLRVEAGVGEDLEAHPVGLAFVVAREAQLARQCRRLADRQRGVGALAAAGRQQRQQHRGQRDHRGVALARQRACQMALLHVADFVAQHRGQFRFALRGEDQPGVHADEAAGQRKGVDRRVAQDEELEVDVARSASRDQLETQPVDVVDGLRIVEVIRAAPDVFEHDLLAVLALVQRRQVLAAGLAQRGQLLCDRHRLQGHQAAQREYKAAGQGKFHGKVAGHEPGGADALYDIRPGRLVPSRTGARGGHPAPDGRRARPRPGAANGKLGVALELFAIVTDGP